MLVVRRLKLLYAQVRELCLKIIGQVRMAWHNSSIIWLRTIYISTLLPTEMDFDGDCITLNHSETSLQSLDFMKKARSAKIEGTCPWLVCTKENFKGHRVRLNPNTDYEILPHDLHRKIASLRVANPNMDSNLQDVDLETHSELKLWKRKSFMLDKKRCNYRLFQKCEKFIFTPKGSKLWKIQLVLFSTFQVIATLPIHLIVCGPI